MLLYVVVLSPAWPESGTAAQVSQMMPCETSLPQSQIGPQGDAPLHVV